jgi:hypothetical protein
MRTKIQFFDRLEFNILRALALGLIYGYIEEAYVKGQNASNDPSLGYGFDLYRVIYTLLLAMPFINSDLRLWLADGVLATLAQDSSFWVYAKELPVQWSWYYPVADHVPLLYLPAIPVILFLYGWISDKNQGAEIE